MGSWEQIQADASFKLDKKVAWCANALHYHKIMSNCGCWCNVALKPSVAETLWISSIVAFCLYVLFVYWSLFIVFQGFVFKWLISWIHSQVCVCRLTVSHCFRYFDQMARNLRQSSCKVEPSTWSSCCAKHKTWTNLASTLQAPAALTSNRSPSIPPKPRLVTRYRCARLVWSKKLQYALTISALPQAWYK